MACRHGCTGLGQGRSEEFSGDDPVRFVISSNLHRRHLTVEQRAEAAARLANLSGRRPKEKVDTGVHFSQPTMSNREAAELFSISPATVKNAKKVLKDGTPELQQAMREGKVGIKKAAELACKSLFDNFSLHAR